MFFTCAEWIIYLLLCNLDDCTFKPSEYVVGTVDNELLIQSPNIEMVNSSIIKRKSIDLMELKISSASKNTHTKNS